MSQIHIILDASVLPRNLRSIGHAFGELRSLVQAGLVSVGIPYVALNEWHSQRRTEYAKCLKEFRKSLDDIRRHERVVAAVLALGSAGFILWKTHGRDLLDLWSLRKAFAKSGQ